MEFGSALLNAIGAFYNAADKEKLMARARDIHTRFAQIEAAVGEEAYFAGDSFSFVDAVFGPVFRYFDVIDAIGDFGIWDGLPKVQRWRRALGARPSVVNAVGPDYPERLGEFLLARGSALSRRASVNPNTRALTA